MTNLGLRFPLRIEALEEAVKVIDTVGVVAAYIYGIMQQPHPKALTLEWAA